MILNIYSEKSAKIEMIIFIINSTDSHKCFWKHQYTKIV